MILHFLGLAGDLLLMVLISLVAAIFGMRCLRLLRLADEDPAVELLFAMGLGLGTLSYGTLLLGIAGLLYPWVAYGLLLLLFLLGASLLPRFLWTLRETLRQARGIRWNVVTWGLLLLLAVHLLLNLLATLAPPSAADALNYHLAVPKAYLRVNTIVDLPGNIHSYFFMNVEMLYLLGMLLSRDILAALFHYLFGLLTVAGILVLGRQVLSATGGLLAAAIFYTSGLVTWEASGAFVELGLAFYVVMSFLAFWRWHGSGDLRWLLLAGIMGGVAAGTKTTGLVFPTIVGLLVLWRCIRDRASVQWKKALGGLALLGLASGLMAGPWLVRNWLFTGNPVFPYLYQVFGGRAWDPAAAAFFLMTNQTRGFGYDLQSLLLLPWNLILRGEPFENSHWLGPLPLALLPLLLWWWRGRPLLGFLGLFILVYLPFLFFTAQVSRYLIPIQPFLAIMVAAVAVALLRPQGVLRWATAAMIAASLALNLGMTAIYDAQFLSVVAGLESKDSFLARKTRLYEDLQWANQNLPPTSEVLLWILEGYYLDRPYVYADPAVQRAFSPNNFANGESFRQYLKAAGITHILKADRTTPEAIANVPPYAASLYRLQGELERTGLKVIYHATRTVRERRTLADQGRTVEVYLYELP